MVVVVFVCACIFVEKQYSVDNATVGIQECVEYIQKSINRLNINTNVSPNTENSDHFIWTRVVSDGPYFIGNIESCVKENVNVSSVFSAKYDHNHNCERGMYYVKQNCESYSHFLNFTNQILVSCNTPKMQSLLQSHMQTNKRTFYAIQTYSKVNFLF